MAIAAAESDADVVVQAELRGRRTVIVGLAGTEPWRPRILAAEGPRARIVFVQSRASLLSGDAVGVRLEVGPGAALEIVELGATIANHVRGGPAATIDVAVELAPGARLVWLAEPLIASAGCSVGRTMSIALATGARAVIGESLVLGRHGETPGGVFSRTRITLDGRPLLDETFATEPAWLRRSAVVAGESRMIAAVTLAGMRDDDAPRGAFQAHEPATLWRSLGPAEVGTRGAGELARRWRALAFDGLETHRMGDRAACVVDARIALAPGTDPAAVGAAVTAELCGHWEHDGPCRWPHNNAIDPTRDPAGFRTVFVASDADEAVVRRRIEDALRRQLQWRVVSVGPRPVAAGERGLAERLCNGPRLEP